VITNNAGATNEVPIFVDGFESGLTTAWSSTVVGP
jgi:hypothetical protein